MTKIATSLTDLVGGTPLLSLVRYAKSRGASAEIIGKLESFNPAGSIKDRVALSMIDDLENRGIISKGATLIEPTSGNTGIGLALVAASRGYRLILTMPETMSIERRQLLSALGAELHLTEGSKGIKGSIERAQELKESIAGSVILNQFSNPSNPAIHYATTANEIWNDTDGEVVAIVAGVGTGGTISGVGKRLKELNPSIEIVAVEPADSPVISGGEAGPHKIQGIGAGFIPSNLDLSVVDRVATATTDEAYSAARDVAKTEGLLIGISGGASLHIATQLAKEPKFAGKKIVVILPDSGERYLSTELFNK